MSRYEYRILKSTWGIAIDLEASYAVSSQKPAIGQRIAYNVWLDFQVKDFILPAEERSWFIKGLKAVSREIQTKFSDLDHILIIISEFDYFPSDYQTEGVALAIIGWAGQEFKFIPPQINIEFDKKLNKYLFSDFPF